MPLSTIFQLYHGGNVFFMHQPKVIVSIKIKSQKKTYLTICQVMTLNVMIVVQHEHPRFSCTNPNNIYRSHENIK
jgi:hypothetical protein